MVRPTSTPHPITTPANKHGVHLLLDDGRNHWPEERWAEHLSYARSAVGEWGFVTQLVRGDDLDPARWQHLLDLCAELHLTPILRLATTYDRDNQWWRAPHPGPGDGYGDLAGQYAEFVTALTWPTSEHYIVVGNEPNHGNEWSGQPDPAAYARYLTGVADALHAADPGARILNAGFDPYTPHTGGQRLIEGMAYWDEESFLDAMVAAHPDVFSHIDAWASHVYPLGPFSAGPWEQIYQADYVYGTPPPDRQPPPAGVVNRGINGYTWELWKLSTYGIADLPVFITETGWRHAETTNAEATDGGISLPDAITVARYFELAWYGNAGRAPEWPDTGWQPWQSDARVVAVTPFAFNGVPAEWGHTNWLILNDNGNVSGIYFTPPANPASSSK
ncbi:MAG: hypothetical protein JXA21_29175 [Anaerolineae bacterium]|nr:hypothetical protein [Anaerolineae bacterium]